jgi:hypothetical protein
MNRSIQLIAVTLLLSLTASPVLAQEGVEGELAGLVRAVNRLVGGMENNQRQQKQELDLRRVGLAVQILDIRARQHDALQEQIRSIDDREQREMTSLSSYATRLKMMKKQISDETDKTIILELETERDQFRTIIENKQKTLDYLAIQRVDLQNRLIEREQRTQEVETVVERWLESLPGQPADTQQARR